VEDARGSSLRGVVGGATQKTSVLAKIGLAPRPVPMMSRMHAADAGGRAAVGLDGGGVVVRLDLEAHAVGRRRSDDAGVVVEDADASAASSRPRSGTRVSSKWLGRPRGRLAGVNGSSWIACTTGLASSRAAIRRASGASGPRRS
jgi:hypothetical protein